MDGLPNDLAHWELIRWAVFEKRRVFDFGTACYARQLRFKKKWGVSFKRSGRLPFLCASLNCLARRCANI